MIGYRKQLGILKQLNQWNYQNINIILLRIQMEIRKARNYLKSRKILWIKNYIVIKFQKINQIKQKKLMMKHLMKIFNKIKS